MISRRNIRIKVMQLLYMMETADDRQLFKNPVQELQKQLDKSRELFVYIIGFLIEVARYAETDAKLRASKNLTTEDDLNVNTKLAGNELLWEILESETYKKAQEIDGVHLRVDKELVRKLYLDLVQTQEYKAYITEQGRDRKKEKEILKYIFTHLMLPSEVFEAHLEEMFNNWDDDGEMIEQLILNYLQKPSAYSLQEMLGEEKWKFARTLLTTVFNKKEQALELIKPKLKNWDAERIAVLDMIIMQMGVCELLYFETIPAKVTINEYIDIAKDYSTPQSGQFVNGILDGIHKDLIAEDKLQKIDFKKKG
ncbi:MAG: transcription antitermination factor NusB [Bacteroidota bacterium]|nr:transcription antitermination factor NusB [Bacteroidota bacterium]